VKAQKKISKTNNLKLLPELLLFFPSIFKGEIILFSNKTEESEFQLQQKLVYVDFASLST
jgi:hypothetical protein